MKMQITDIFERDEIFDGSPNFMDGFLVMNVLNHNALGGGSKKDLDDWKKEVDCDNPKRYKIRVIIEVGEYDD